MNQVSSVLGSLQSPGLVGVPLHTIVREARGDPGTDQGQPPLPAQHLHPVLSPAQVVVVDLAVGLECGGATVNQSTTVNIFYRFLK